MADLHRQRETDWGRQDGEKSSCKTKTERDSQMECVYMCVSVCCSRVGEYFQNTLHVQTNYACVHTHMHTCVRQIGFYSPWDFIVHASLKSTLPPTGTKLISASLTDLWHFHHLMCLNESLSVCARVCVYIRVYCSTWRPRKYGHSWPGASFRTVGKTRLRCSAQTSDTHNAEVMRFLLKNRFTTIL